MEDKKKVVEEAKVNQDRTYSGEGISVRSLEERPADLDTISVRDLDEARVGVHTEDTDAGSVQFGCIDIERERAPEAVDMMQVFALTGDSFYLDLVNKSESELEALLRELENEPEDEDDEMSEQERKGHVAALYALGETDLSVQNNENGPVEDNGLSSEEIGIAAWIGANE